MQGGDIEVMKIDYSLFGNLKIIAEDSRDSAYLESLISDYWNNLDFADSRDIIIESFEKDQELQLEEFYQVKNHKNKYKYQFLIGAIEFRGA